MPLRSWLQHAFVDRSQSDQLAQSDSDADRQSAQKVNLFKTDFVALDLRYADRISERYRMSISLIAAYDKTTK